MSIGMTNGRIPKRVTAYLRPEEEILGAGRPRNSWTFPPNQRETAGFAKTRASAAFVVPSDSEAFNKSGLKWAMEGRTKPSQGVNRIEVENKPFTNLRWVGIDSRMEGGVASQKLKDTPAIPEKDLKVGTIYKDRRGKDVVLLGRGDTKGKKFLMMEVYAGYHRGDNQQQVNESIAQLAKSNVYPNWLLSGSMTVVQETGTVKVPDDLIERFVKKMRSWI